MVDFDPTTADRLALHGEPSALVIGEAKSPAAELLLEDSILLAEIIDDGVLVPIDLASQSGEQDLPRLEDLCHRGSLRNVTESGKLLIPLKDA